MSLAIEKYKQLLCIKEHQLAIRMKKIEEQITQHQQTIAALNHRLMNESPVQTQWIVPEIEMARLQFQLKIEEQIEELEGRIREAQSRLLPLNQSLLKLQTEAKRLDKALARQADLAQEEEQKQQQQRLDEWVLFSQEAR